VTYIGESVTAQGMRLIGVHTITPTSNRDEIWKAVDTARRKSDLVLLDEVPAQRVRYDLEALLLRHPLPPVLIIPDMRGDQIMSSATVEEARRVLGIEENYGHI